METAFIPLAVHPPRVARFLATARPDVNPAQAFKSLQAFEALAEGWQSRTEPRSLVPIGQACHASFP